MAEEKKNVVENEEKEELVFEPTIDLLPEEIRFICKMCHIASNKRLESKLACASVTVEGRLCKHVERLRSTLNGQARQLESFRKYASAFILERFGDRTAFQKSEIAKWYNEKIVDGKRSLDEFIDLLQLIGVDVVGS